MTFIFGKSRYPTLVVVQCAGCGNETTLQRDAWLAAKATCPSCTGILVPIRVIVGRTDQGKAEHQRQRTELAARRLPRFAPAPHPV